MEITFRMICPYPFAKCCYIPCVLQIQMSCMQFHTWNSYSKHYKTSGWQEPGKLKRFPFRNVCAYMSLAFDAQKPSSIHILNNFITCHLVTCRQNILLFSKTFFFFFWKNHPTLHSAPIVLSPWRTKQCTWRVGILRDFFFPSIWKSLLSEK